MQIHIFIDRLLLGGELDRNKLPVANIMYSLREIFFISQYQCQHQCQCPFPISIYNDRKISNEAERGFAITRSRSDEITVAVGRKEKP
jgi:hypothetical protein